MKSQELRNVMAVQIDGQAWLVVTLDHVKPGKGPAYVQAKLKNVQRCVVDRYEAGSVARGTARDVPLLENDDVFDTFFGEVIRDTTPGDATADDHDTGLALHAGFDSLQTGCFKGAVLKKHRRAGSRNVV